MENCCAPSQGEALQQKAHVDCLTLKMKQYNPLKVTYLVTKYHIPEDLYIQENVMFSCFPASQWTLVL